MKQNLVKKLALTLALANTISLSACDTSNDLSDLTSILAADAKVNINSCV